MDEAKAYNRLGRRFSGHETVNHSIEEYVRGDAHADTAENHFSIFKRGVAGVYHHVSRQHSKRYPAEFDFRYSERAGSGVEDQERTERALRGMLGTRPTYHGSPQGPLTVQG